MAEPLPPGLRRETVASAVAAHLTALMPSDAQAFAVAMDELMAFSRAFGITVQDQGASVRIYRGALGDLPADLVITAVRRAVASWTWGNRLPMPGDLRRSVADDLHQRRRHLAKAEAALRKLNAAVDQPRARQPTPEELAVVEAAMAKLRANPPTPRRMDADRADGREPSNEPMTAVRARVAAEMVSRTRIEVPR